MNTQNNKEKNLQKALKYIDEAAIDGADLVSLPEYFNFLGSNEDRDHMSEYIPGPTTEIMIEKAKEHNIYIHAGSILEKTGGNKHYNTTVFIDRNGKITGKYQKIHLFDIDIEGKVSAKESDTIKPGKDITVTDTEFGKVGLSICYDVRFPELYRTLALRGAKILFIPSAFTLYTGIHHWEALLKARAIENQCYVIASGQIGSYPPDNKTNFGSSMIVDPWGIVIAKSSEKEGVITARIDFGEIDRVRQSIPAFNHRKPNIYDI